MTLKIVAPRKRLPFNLLRPAIVSEFLVHNSWIKAKQERDEGTKPESAKDKIPGPRRTLQLRLTSPLTQPIKQTASEQILYFNCGVRRYKAPHSAM